MEKAKTHSKPGVSSSVNADSMTVEQLREKIMAGYDDMVQGRTQDASAVFARFREEHQ